VISGIQTKSNRKCRGLDGAGRRKYGSRELKIVYNKINQNPLFYNSQIETFQIYNTKQNRRQISSTTVPDSCT